MSPLTIVRICNLEGNACFNCGCRVNVPIGDRGIDRMRFVFGPYGLDVCAKDRCDERPRDVSVVLTSSSYRDRPESGEDEKALRELRANLRSAEREAPRTDRENIGRISMVW